MHCRDVSLMLAIKAGRFKRSIMGMLFGVLNHINEAGGQAKGIGSVSHVQGYADVGLGEDRMLSKSVGVGRCASEGPFLQGR